MTSRENENQVLEAAEPPASKRELWKRVEPASGEWPWMVYDVGAMDSSWCQDEAEARAALDTRDPVAAKESL